MAPHKTLNPILVVAITLLSLYATSNAMLVVSADCEDELAQVREELEEVKEERDLYAQRLEDQTMVLIVVMFLLVGSYFFFYLSARRQRVFILEVEKRLGVEIIPRSKPRRRRRG